MAVGRRARNQLGGNCAVRAVAVLDDEGLAEPLRKPLREEPSDDVGSTAGDSADQKANRTRWIDLCSCDARDCRQRRLRRRQVAQVDDGEFSPLVQFAFAARKFDDLCPFLGFIGEELAELIGSHRHRLAAKVFEPGQELRVVETSGDGGIELIDNVFWRAAGRAGSVPGGGVETGQEFGDSRNIGQNIRPRRAGHRQCAQLAGPDKADCRGDGDDERLDLPGQQIRERAAPGRDRARE